MSEEGPGLKHYVYERLRTMIDSGLYSKKEVFDAISQEIASAQELAPEGPKMRGYAAKRWSAREAEEATWRAPTANDRLDAAFAALNAAGFVALQNAGWTNTMGWEDCWCAYHERRERGEAPRGAVFYHYQDLERGVAGQGLMLGFGCFHEEDNGDLPGNAQVAEAVCRVLAAHGIATRWEGDPRTRIEVLPFPWQRRRYTKAPPLPTPWRRFRHEDGRAWHARVAGSTVELRIYLTPDDEPIERRRPCSDPAAAALTAAALIEEQRAEGFTEEPADPAA